MINYPAMNHLQFSANVQEILDEQLKYDLQNLAYYGGFQLLDLSIKELKRHMTCYNSMPLIG